MRHPRVRVLLALGVTLFASSVTALAPARAAGDREAGGTTDQAVAYQITPRHDGFLQDGALEPPLSRRWSVAFRRPVSYPLIARGKVFVTEGAVQSRGSTIFALDRSDGHTIWSRTIGGWTNWSTAAYAHGRLFVVNAGGTLEALDADTGRTIWIDLLGGTVTSPPTAAGGIVYVGQDGGRLLAVDAATGSIRWAQPVDGGGDSSPTLSRHGVFVSYSCPQVYAFDRMSGDLRWHHSSSCSGGGGSTSVYHDGRLYVPDLEAPYVLDGRTGALVGSFEATRPPAFAAHVGLFLSGHTLTATDVSTGASLWTFGRHALNTAPIVVNGTAFVGAWSGTLFGVSLTDGAEVWEADVGFHIPAPNQQAFDKPLTGLGAGQGLLVVPAGRHLVAFGGT